MCGDLSWGLALNPEDESLILSDGRNRRDSTVFMSMDGCMGKMESMEMELYAGGDMYFNHTAMTDFVGDRISGFMGDMMTEMICSVRGRGICRQEEETEAEQNTQ